MSCAIASRLTSRGSSVCWRPNASSRCVNVGRPACAVFGPLHEADDVGRPALLHAYANHAQTTHDRLQHVVEVVRDAAGELADRLQFLAMAQTFFGARAFAAFTMKRIQRRLQFRGALGYARFEFLAAASSASRTREPDPRYRWMSRASRQCGLRPARASRGSGTSGKCGRTARRMRCSTAIFALRLAIAPRRHGCLPVTGMDAIEPSQPRLPLRNAAIFDPLRTAPRALSRNVEVKTSCGICVASMR